MLTPAECRSAGYSVTVWCSRCRYGRALDLLAFDIAGTASVPLKRLFRRMVCQDCGGPASELVVSRMVVGVNEDVLRLRSMVQVAGTMESGTGKASR